MEQQQTPVGSGLAQFDQLLGGLFIGDNVVWLDDAGSLASVFCLNFLAASQGRERPLIYVSFDRSPTNLLEKLGPLASSPHLFILDCFTWGKGAGSDIFTRFYDLPAEMRPCRVIPVPQPQDVAKFSEAFYSLHATLSGDVRFVFESLTGMQELWGSEEQLIHFYSHACPRLYELKTIAYWVMEKQAHSARLRAQIGQIAQVVIDLAVKRGTTSLTIIKAEKRPSETHHQPHTYFVRDLEVVFERERHSGLDLGQRLKDLRGQKGLSQTELSRLVGVTPSTISQVESNLIYPSLPALLKMAEVRATPISSFFVESSPNPLRLVFGQADAQAAGLAGLAKESVAAWRLMPQGAGGKAEPWMVEIRPKQELAAHFFMHKGEELGYLLAGRLQMRAQGQTHSMRPGELVHLTNQIPSGWSNPGRTPARLLWLLLR
jgi:transcriptional regulator with XRE-family HTH domain/KaiC/GvpD/RAD55 family RecA-like ATPase